MSATLILEALTLLLAIPVVAQAEHRSGIGMAVVGVLALLHVHACTKVNRPWFLGYVLVLQILIVACWFFHGAVAVMGVVFGLVWLALRWFRDEYRRRERDGRLPGAGSAAAGGTENA